MENKKYTAGQLLNVLQSYANMIDRGGTKYPAAVLDDIRKKH